MREDSNFFTNGRGVRLHYRVWSPAGVPKAILLHLHGFAEHSGRYAHTAKYFTDRGFGLWALDFTGHGKSEGARADIKRFSLFAEDAAAFLKLAAEKNPGTPLFLYGHSMGAAVALLTLTSLKREDSWDGLRNRIKGMIFTGACIVVAGNYSPLLVKISKLIAALFPRLPAAPFDVTILSKDEEVRKAYIEDPLTYSAPTKTRMGAMLLGLRELIPPVLPDVDLPALILHGESDALIDPESSRIVYDGISSTDKTLKFYPGLFHEIHNEPEQAEVFGDMADWIQKRV